MTAMHRKTETATIVGCGIAGPVLGLALARAGIRATIFEGRAELEADGAFLGIAPNGMNALALLGLANDVAARGFPSEGMIFVNSRNQPIATTDQREDEARFGARLVMIRRSELTAALAEAAQRAGIDVRFDARCTGIDTEPGGAVVARFEDGTEARADVLLGCDGIHSAVRRLAIPSAAAPAYTGLVNYGGYARVPGLRLEPGWTRFLFGRRSFFGMLGAPDGEVWWFHNHAAASDAGHPAGDRAIEHMLALHAGDDPVVAGILRHTTSFGGPWPIYDILESPAWSSGPVALVGDAAHATSPHAGQGASLAIEDALVIAQCLRDVPDTARALAAYDGIRRARVEAIVKQGRRTGSSKVASGPIAEWFRDRMLPLFLKLATKAQGEAYAHRIEWDRRVA